MGEAVHSPCRRVPYRSLGVRWATVALAVIALWAGACSDFMGLTLAGSDASAPVDASGAREAGCTLVHPPPPSILASVQRGQVDFDVVVWHEDLGDAVDAGAPPYLTIGYDLDDTCTTVDSGASCKEPAWASGTGHADAPGGIDNAVGAALYQLNLTSAGAATDLVGTSTATGGLALAIRVRGYSELGVEGDVDVSYFGVGLTGDGGLPSPAWDGHDPWQVYRNWLAAPEPGAAYDLGVPLFEDKHAYVTNGLLVSRVDHLLVGATPSFLLSHVIVTAQITRSGSSWVLSNGTIAGRVSVDALLESLAYATDGFTLNPFCVGVGGYSTAKMLTCANTDISYEGPDDGSQPCDGASWAWRFIDTVPASLEAVGPALPDLYVATCSPGQSPLDDRCAP